MNVFSNISKNIKNNSIINLVQVFKNLISSSQSFSSSNLIINNCSNNNNDNMGNNVYQLTKEEFYFFGCYLSFLLFHYYNNNKIVIQILKNNFENILYQFFQKVVILDPQQQQQQQQQPNNSQIHNFIRYFLFSSLLIYFINEKKNFNYQNIQNNNSYSGSNNFINELNLFKGSFSYLKNRTSLQIIHTINQIFDFIFIEEMSEFFPEEFLREFKLYFKSIKLFQ